jgi:hypothetical protein
MYERTSPQLNTNSFSGSADHDSLMARHRIAPGATAEGSGDETPSSFTLPERICSCQRRTAGSNGGFNMLDHLPDVGVQDREQE